MSSKDQSSNSKGSKGHQGLGKPKMLNENAKGMAGNTNIVQEVDGGVALTPDKGKIVEQTAVSRTPKGFVLGMVPAETAAARRDSIGSIVTHKQMPARYAALPSPTGSVDTVIFTGDKDSGSRGKHARVQSIESVILSDDIKSPKADNAKKVASAQASDVQERENINVTDTMKVYHDTTVDDASHVADVTASRITNSALKIYATKDALNGALNAVKKERLDDQLHNQSAMFQLHHNQQAAAAFLQQQHKEVAASLQSQQAQAMMVLKEQKDAVVGLNQHQDDLFLNVKQLETSATTAAESLTELQRKQQEFRAESAKIQRNMQELQKKQEEAAAAQQTLQHDQQMAQRTQRAVDGVLATLKQGEKSQMRFNDTAEQVLAQHHNRIEQNEQNLLAVMARIQVLEHNAMANHASIAPVGAQHGNQAAYTRAGLFNFHGGLHSSVAGQSSNYDAAHPNNNNPAQSVYSHATQVPGPSTYHSGVPASRRSNDIGSRPNFPAPANAQDDVFTSQNFDTTPRTMIVQFERKTMHELFNSQNVKIEQFVRQFCEVAIPLDILKKVAPRLIKYVREHVDSSKLADFFLTDDVHRKFAVTGVISRWIVYSFWEMPFIDQFPSPFAKDLVRGFRNEQRMSSDVDFENKYPLRLQITTARAQLGKNIGATPGFQKWLQDKAASSARDLLAILLPLIQPRNLIIAEKALNGIMLEAVRMSARMRTEVKLYNFHFYRYGTRWEHKHMVQHTPGLEGQACDEDPSIYVVHCSTGPQVCEKTFIGNTGISKVATIKGEVILCPRVGNLR